MRSPHLSNEKKFWAFVSYSSRDRKWGTWLHGRLENYPIPEEFRGTEIFDGAILGKNLRPVFRDRDELAGSSNLGPAILDALRASRFLVVLCSPNSANSAWVNKEIEDFRTLDPKNNDRILALILEGEPNASSNPDLDSALECFPPALRYPAEPLAGDMRKDGDGKERGFLKILSGISQLNFDTLYRRHERLQRKKRLLFAGIASAVILALSYLTVFAFAQKREAETQKATAIRRHVETLYGEGIHSLARGDSLAALDYFLQTLDQRPDWDAPRAHVTELLARKYWPVGERSISLATNEDEEYFMRQVQSSQLLTPDNSLLLSSYAGLRLIDPDTGETSFASSDEINKKLEGAPFVDTEFTYQEVNCDWQNGVIYGLKSSTELFLYLIEEKRMITTKADEVLEFDLG